MKKKRNLASEIISLRDKFQFIFQSTISWRASSQANHSSSSSFEFSSMSRGKEERKDSKWFLHLFISNARRHGEKKGLKKFSLVKRWNLKTTQSFAIKFHAISFHFLVLLYSSRSDAFGSSEGPLMTCYQPWKWDKWDDPPCESGDKESRKGKFFIEFFRRSFLRSFDDTQERSH